MSAWIFGTRNIELNKKTFEEFQSYFFKVTKDIDWIWVVELVERKAHHLYLFCKEKQFKRFKEEAINNIVSSNEDWKEIKVPSIESEKMDVSRFFWKYPFRYMEDNHITLYTDYYG